MSRQLYGELGDERGVATATHNLARLQVERGEYRRGIAGLLSALATFRRIDARGQEVNTLGRLAEAHRRSHDLESAMSFAQEALWLAGRLSDHANQGFNLTELALAGYELGDLSAARGNAERALMIHTRLNGFAQAGRTSALLANICRDGGDLRGAEHHARSAAALCRRGRQPDAEAANTQLLGDILYAQARHDEAVDAWSKALAIFEDLGDPRANSVRDSLAEVAKAFHIQPPEQTRPLNGNRAQPGFTSYPHYR
jgi:tetratricopeptide (TPR) repeat protein